MLKALIWDIDGTVAETERDGHRVAFNVAFKEFGLPWRWDVATYGRLLQVAGGYDRLLHDMAMREQAPRGEPERARLARALHQRKAELYAERLGRRAVPLRPGVRALMEDGAAGGVAMAIATTTGRANVALLMRPEFGAHWQDRFAAVLCAEDALRKKPDPQVYLLALQQLGCRADGALAIEDSPNGLAAACGAGIGAIVTRSAYFADAEFTGALAVCRDLEQAGLTSIERLRELSSAPCPCARSAAASCR